MPILDDIKTSLRVTSPKLDAEVTMLIDAALSNMRRKGVDPDLLVIDGDGNIADSEVQLAVTLYCKENFGYDNSEAYRFGEAYRNVVCHLMAHENIREKVPDDEVE